MLTVREFGNKNPKSLLPNRLDFFFSFVLSFEELWGVASGTIPWVFSLGEVFSSLRRVFSSWSWALNWRNDSLSRSALLMSSCKSRMVLLWASICFLKMSISSAWWTMRFNNSESSLLSNVDTLNNIWQANKLIFLYSSTFVMQIVFSLMTKQRVSDRDFSILPSSWKHIKEKSLFSSRKLFTLAAAPLTVSGALSLSSRE